jgi:hypothetical protein
MTTCRSPGGGGRVSDGVPSARDATSRSTNDVAPSAASATSVCIQTARAAVAARMRGNTHRQRAHVTVENTTLDATKTSGASNARGPRKRRRK